MAKKGGLGMGLDALFEDNAAGEGQAKITLRLSDIEPNKHQPRNDFNEEAINSLADSIREHGLLQPILVRPLGEHGNYQIVAGERRWRACRKLGMSEIPVIIRELTDMETAQIALIENLQRENLNPLEESLGYASLINEYDMTQDEVSRTVGRSRSTIANALRLLRLPDEVQQMLRQGRLSAGQGKALAGFSNEEHLLEAAHKAADGHLTVRALEKLASNDTRGIASPSGDEEELITTPEERSRDSYFREMELALHDALGRKVTVGRDKNGKKGTLLLEFYDEQDLSSLAERLLR